MVDSYLHLGPLSIRWYTIFLSLAVLLPYYLIRKNSSRFKISKDQIDNLLLLVVPSGIIGARVYHVVDHWIYYQRHLLEILFIWQGGLGIFGGLLAGSLASWWYCRRNKLDFLNLLDLITPYLLLGQAIGRVGNFFNSEGSGPPTTLPWGITIQGQVVHPTFFYEGLWDALGALVLVKVGPIRLRSWPEGSSEPRTARRKGLPTAFYLVIYGSGRFIAEYFRLDTLQVNGFKVGFLVASSLVLIGLYLILKSTKLWRHFYEP